MACATATRGRAPAITIGSANPASRRRSELPLAAGCFADTDEARCLGRRLQRRTQLSPAPRGALPYAGARKPSCDRMTSAQFIRAKSFNCSRTLGGSIHSMYLRAWCEGQGPCLIMIASTPICMTALAFDGKPAHVQTDRIFWSRKSIETSDGVCHP